ncbi:CHAP domain-containing protein [Acinetobacter tianfuensis]|uniref:CHAP domain-containing protein n=1 Tax=Acinetobacter tianfuensis TaxID=2419603 RepID=A0A3A8EA55_9GAMM|nr:CHAP domain-containing protein [Acinetobacter tianfuensis]RKG31737.1 CHAP domain-containing protein [Acinetobacter tianfuensis]
MAYDQSVDMQSVHAPVPAQIVIRSQQGKPPSAQDRKPAKAQESQYKNIFGSNGQRIDIDRFAQKLRNITAMSSSQRCARSVRIALESAGAKFNGHPVAAADWGSTLQKVGFERINLAFDRPQKGDIYIIKRTQKHVYGHIAAYTGSHWVSDYRQRGYAVYKDPNVRYEYYRPSK